MKLYTRSAVQRFLYAAVLVFTAFATPLFADAWSEPAGFYDSAEGKTGSTLKTELYVLMTFGQRQQSYGSYRYMSSIIDADPNHPGNILLVYNRASVSGNWDSGITWNREHVWPQSRQPGSASNSSTGNLGDPHALRPCNPSINGSRSNYPFGTQYSSGSYGLSGGYWFPGEYDKGDIARSLFYSSTRYNLTLVNGYPSGYEMGDLQALMKWHYDDVPDEFERRRNHAIYSQALNPYYYTNNRNAFIDRPEYAWSVFMDQDNDSQVYVGSSPAGDGSSTQTLDLGRVIVGGTAPGSQSVTIHKTGQDGTYYSITSTGDATSSVAGRFNAFGMGGSGSETIQVGLNASTSTPGLASGQVVVDNLDVTTGYGLGHGDRDGDDVIDVQLEVLAHSEGSFVATSNSDSLLVDFGIVPPSATTQTLPFSIYNLADASGYTADLVVSDTTGAGQTSLLWPSLNGSSAVGGGSIAGEAILLPDVAPGNISATWTIGVSDEALSGASDGNDLTLTMQATVAGLGDADLSGRVDADDLAILGMHWSPQQNGSEWSDGDFNGDGAVDANDLATLGLHWAPAGYVPEPLSAVLLTLATPLLLRRRLGANGEKKTFYFMPQDHCNGCEAGTIDL